MIFIDAETIAICYSEQSIWIWNLKTEDSAILSLNTEKGFELFDQILCISYSPKKGTFFFVNLNLFKKKFFN